MSRPVRRTVGRTVLLVGLVGALVGPFLPLIVWAFTRTWRYPALWPQSIGTRGLRALADSGTGIGHGLAASTGIAAAVCVASAGVGLAAGRVLGLHAFPGRRLVQGVLAAPVLVPGVVLAPGLQVAFVRIGVSGTLAGVLLAQLVPAAAYTTLVLSAAYARFDPAVETQARVLGTGPARVLVHVTLPALRPALAVAMLLAFLISWDDYLLTLLVGGGSVSTLPVLLYAAIGGTDTTVAAALALVVVLPPLLLTAVTARALATGHGSPAGRAPGRARPVEHLRGRSDDDAA